MSDANFNASKQMATKPRISLLSSKLTNVRLKSDDQPDQPPAAHDGYINIGSTNSMEQTVPNAQQLDLEGQVLDAELKESQRLNESVLNDEDKMNISKEDLIRLLSMLKSELHSKEIALAAIKCEQLKRLINPVEISRSSLASTYIELQDRFKIQDQNNNDTDKAETQPSSASTENQQKNENLELPKNRVKDLDDDESLNILNALLELLDRHPLLALPRDSIFCLDYNCNEISTKNYLNLKIQHLDNLINQHRRFRYYMNERLKRSEQRFVDLTREYELEKSLKHEQETSHYKTNGKKILLKHIDDLKEALEKEKSDKEAIVMTLLNELLDERDKTDALARKLADHVSSPASSSENNIAENEKLSQMEAEVNNISMQLKKQSMVFMKERSELQSKVSELESENTSLKIRLEQQEKRISALIKSTSENSESSQLAITPNKPNVASKNLTNKQASVGKPHSVSPAIVSRTTVGTTMAKSSPSSPKGPSTNVNQSSSVINPSSNNGTQSISSARHNTTSAISHRISSSILNKDPDQSATIRVQPLFKSASVSSTTQQVRTMKTSVSGGSITTSSNRVSNNQPVTKPQVPAKPAQLLDHQRNSIN